MEWVIFPIFHHAFCFKCFPLCTTIITPVNHYPILASRNKVKKFVDVCLSFGWQAFHLAANKICFIFIVGKF